jgi:hypothetical protein
VGCRAYFSEAYAGLKAAVADALAAINRLHGSDVPAAFERAVRVASERRQFWSNVSFGSILLKNSPDEPNGSISASASRRWISQNQ